MLANQSNKLYYLLTIFLMVRCWAECTTRPIIGVLAQEYFYHKNGSFIPASYVKAVEASGARVVPIFIGKDKDYYVQLLSELNGIVFPGGSASLHAKNGYAEAGKYIFEEAIYLNDHGRNMPILAVCLGMQLLATITNNGRDLLAHCSGTKNSALNLIFKNGYRDSSLYGNTTTYEVSALTNYNLTSNQHSWCVTEKNLTHFKLDKFWKVLTVNHDAKNMEFISSMEAFKYPFVGVQFHPEKVAFEWNPSLRTPHSTMAVQVNRLFYDWLVYQSRFSKNRFNSTDIENSLSIYNFVPVFTGKSGGYSDQLYEFRW